jgi:hypothetical protein
MHADTTDEKARKTDRGIIFALTALLFFPFSFDILDEASTNLLGKG